MTVCTIQLNILSTSLKAFDHFKIQHEMNLGPRNVELPWCPDLNPNIHPLYFLLGDTNCKGLAFKHLSSGRVLVVSFLAF